MILASPDLLVNHVDQGSCHKQCETEDRSSKRESFWQGQDGFKMFQNMPKAVEDRPQQFLLVLLQIWRKVHWSLLPQSIDR